MFPMTVFSLTYGSRRFDVDVHCISDNSDDQDAAFTVITRVHDLTDETGETYTTNAIEDLDRDALLEVLVTRSMAYALLYLGGAKLQRLSAQEIVDFASDAADDGLAAAGDDWQIYLGEDHYSMQPALDGFQDWALGNLPLTVPMPYWLWYDIRTLCGINFHPMMAA